MQALASCSFDKHGLILIIFGKLHQHTSRMKVCLWWLPKIIIIISLCLLKLQLAKVGTFFETQCSFDLV